MDSSAKSPNSSTRLRRRLNLGSLLSRRFSHLFPHRKDHSRHSDQPPPRRASSSAPSYARYARSPIAPPPPVHRNSPSYSQDDVRSEPPHKLSTIIDPTHVAAETDDDSGPSANPSLTASSRKSIPQSPVTGTSQSASTVGSAVSKSPLQRADQPLSAPIASPFRPHTVRFEIDTLPPAETLSDHTPPARPLYPKHQRSSTTSPHTFLSDDSPITSPILTSHCPLVNTSATHTLHPESDSPEGEHAHSLVSSDSESDSSLPSAHNEIASPNVKDPAPTKFSQPLTFNMHSTTRRSPVTLSAHPRAPKSMAVPTALRFDDLDSPSAIPPAPSNTSHGKPPLPPTRNIHRPRIRAPPPHPTSHGSERKEGAATNRDASAPLDTSLSEEYASISERGERVAAAFERLGKQTYEYQDSPSDLAGGLSPKEVIIPLIVEAMRQHRSDPKVADRALTILRRLTVSENCRKCIGENGGIEAVVEIMRSHSLRAGIQTQGCLTLANLAFRNRTNKEAVMKCSGLKVVVAALSAHQDVEQIQAWGCLAIRNFTNRSDAGEQETSVASGAVEVLLTALERYIDSETVQSNALIALTNIASRSPYGMERLRTAGGIEVLVSALQHNVRSEKLSEVGMSLTRVVVEDDRNKELFGQANGIQAMTAIMDAHRGQLAISVKGCAAVRHLAFRRKNREILGSCGTIRTVVNIMNECTTASPDGVCYFLKALCNATFDSMASKIFAGRSGAIEATLRIMSEEAYKEVGRVVEDACRLLRNLLDGVVQNQRNLLKHRGIAVVLDAARAHGEALAGVAEHSVAIFVSMAASRGFASQVQEGSGDINQVARRLRKAHEGNPRVETQVNSLVRALEHDERSVNSLGSSDLRDWRNKSSLERALRPVRSLHRGRSGDEQEKRLQRLRSMPLPLGRNRS